MMINRGVQPVKRIRSSKLVA